MYVKEVLDDLGIRIKLPQHWYSTDVGAEFEEPKLIQNDDIIKIEAESGENTKIITCEGVDYAVESTGHVITTDENGYVESPELDTGVYFLVETKAPDGFNLPAEAFKVYAESALLGEPEVYIIENAPGNILPETGGIGTHAFTATGWVMTMIAGAALVFRKKTKA